MTARIAVILAGGSEKMAEAISRVAEVIGVAFQIQDDILDITLEGREREKFGKDFGNDIKEGKRTLMVIRTLRKATKKDKNKLIRILGKHTDNVREKKEAIEIIKRYGAIEYAKNTAKRIMREAWQEANKLLPESPAKKKLKEFINYLIERKV